MKKKLYITFVLAIIAIMLASFANAGCNFVSGKQELTVDYNPSIPKLNMATNAYEILEAIVLDCTGTDLKWFFATLKFRETSFGNNSVGGEFDYAGIIQKLPDIIDEGVFNKNFVKSIVNKNFAPKIINHCPITLLDRPILNFGGTLQSYIWTMSKTKISANSEASVECTDTIVVNSPVATTLEVPVKVSGSLVSAYSFGQPPDTSGTGKLKITGQFMGQPLDISGEAKATGIIPSVDDGSLINLEKEIKVKIPVNAGTNQFTYSFKAEGSVSSTAKSLSPLGLMAAAANTGVNFPNTIRVGNFQGEAGQTLPEGIEIKSKETGQSYYRTEENASSTVTVPDLTDFIYSGKNNALEIVLKVIGLPLGSVVEEDSSFSKGTVIGQSLTAGTEVQTGSTIDLAVSKGQIVDVPNLTNLTLEEAKTRLENLSLAPDATYTSTNEYAENKVIAQQPSPGTEVNTGSVVSFWITRKKSPVCLPPLLLLLQ
jgi:beta-lactam-binding protein with PASTA domain